MNIPARLKELLLLLAGMFFLSLVSAQPAFQWAKAYNGTANSLDYGRALKLDRYGNAYICGTVSNTGTGKDIAVIKYDGGGGQTWAAVYNGDDNGDDWGYGLVIDDSGNAYATGSVATANSGKDIITVKFDASGNFKWAKQYNGPGNLDDQANHIAADPQGNIIITGISKGDTTADDYVTIKYNPGGTQLWVKRYNGPANAVDDARTITADKDANVYVSGGSTGIGTGYDFTTVKYDSAGNEKWVARYDGPLHDYDLVYYQGSVVADSLDNVYITGYSTGLDSTLDVTTVKYDSSGNQVWAKRFSAEANGNDYADGITIDDSLNVYTIGASYRTGNNYDFVTIKYDSSGAQKWVEYYNGAGNDWDEAYGVVTDSQHNVYIVGRSPGVSTSADFVIVKYDPSGGEIWEQRYDNSGYDWPFNIRLAGDGCIYAGGSFGSTISDMGVLKYCQWPAGVSAVSQSSNAPALVPNPASDHVSITYPGGIVAGSTISIFNLSGQLLKKVVVADKTDLVTIPVNGLPEGIYVCKLVAVSASFTRMLIIQN